MMELDNRYQEIRIQPAQKHEHILIVNFVNKDLRSPQRIRTLENEMMHLSEQKKFTRLVVDFSGVQVAPTAIFGIVLHLVATGRQRGIETRVCCLAKSLRRAFDLLNQGGLVAVFDKQMLAVCAPWPDKGKSGRRPRIPTRPWWRIWG